MNQSQDLKQQREQQVKAFIELIDIPNFKDTGMLEIALIHPSYSYEINSSKEVKDLLEKLYKRLAHLGDAIFSAIVTDCLFESCPSCTIAELTEGKKLLVDKSLLFEFAKQLKLQQFCLLGKSQQGKPLDGQEKLFAEMFKAVFGAIYLEFERDFSKARTWLNEQFLEEAIELLLKDEDEDDEYDELNEHYESSSVTTREYLDMIGLQDFPDYGWAPGDDD